jgi:hypothetical protein
VFLVNNLRWNVTAAMTNRRWGRDDVRALSPPVSFSHPNEPQQLHVAPGADPTTAVVQWATADASRPRVRWSASPLRVSGSSGGGSGGGRDGNSSVFVVEGATSTYSRDQMCGGFAKGAGWFEPGSLHRATLRGLPAASQVFYEVFDEGNRAEAAAAAAAGKGVENDAKDAARAVRRFGSFSTPALPREEERGEARIVLMADAGAFRVFSFSFFWTEREKRATEEKKEKEKEK